jgi:NAD(P)-dependent dehydrogenase (short-subunit alcohol dehydrogenase family)
MNDKIAVIFGRGGVGTAVQEAFARAGAKTFITSSAEVDALDEAKVERHLDHVLEKAGRIDIVLNATGIPQSGIQGIPLTELSVDAFMKPVIHYARTSFVIAKAAGRRMAKQKSGLMLFHTPEPARLGMPLVGGMTVAWAGMEALTRSLSAELAPQGVRVVCLRTTGLPETSTIDTVFGIHAKAVGITREQFTAMVESRTHRQRSTSLAELAATAVFLTSNGAAALTGTTLNLTGGLTSD